MGGLSLSFLVELANSLRVTALAVAQLVAGSSNGRVLNAIFLVAGFFVLLVLAGTRSKTTGDRADVFFAFAFLVGAWTYSAILGARISTDIIHLVDRESLAAYLSTFSLIGRASYLLLLGTATLLAWEAPAVRRFLRPMGIAGAVVATVLVIERLQYLFTGPGAGPLSGAAPRSAHVVYHLTQVAVAATMAFILAAWARPLPAALLGPWLLIGLSELTMAGEHLRDRGFAQDLSLLSQLAFLIHIPLLFLAMALRDRRQLFAAASRLRTQFASVFSALLNLEEASDAALRRHSQRHADLARPTAKRLGMSWEEVEEVYWAALLHDIGKLSLDREVFSAPRPLTSEEWNLVRRHPTLGARVLDGIPGLERVMAFIRHHHERWDGSGYPDGLQGEEIPLGARIVGVIDAFDAMISSRAYRRPRSLLGAIEEVAQQSGRHFDPAVVTAFLDVLAEQSNQVSEGS